MNIPIEQRQPRHSDLASNRFVILALVAAVVMLLIACAVASSRKYLWYDELVSFYLTTDPSPAHMVHSIANNVDTAPPIYHLIGWVWIRIFGGNPFGLRLFSSLGLGLSILVMWTLLKRVYGGWIALVSVLLVFMLSEQILYQNAEARFYGLYMLLCVLTIAMYQHLGEQKPVSRRMLILNAATHATLILTHYPGVVYSGVVLLAFIMRDLSRRERNIAHYASILAGWGLFLPWLPAFINQFSLAREVSWIVRPNLELLSAMYLRGISLHIPLTLIAFAIGSLLGRRKYAAVPINAPRLSLRIIGICFLLSPFVNWLLSQFTTSLFYPRYMLPTAFGWIILLADAAVPTLTALFQMTTRSVVFRVVIALWIAFLLCVPVLDAFRFNELTSPLENIEQVGNNDLPIVTTGPIRFFLIYYYAPPDQKSRYHVILDWAASIDKRSHITGPAGFRLMEAFKTAYPQIGQNIVTISDFLGRYDRFLVLDDGMNAWPKLYLTEALGYKWTSLGKIADVPLSLVEKK
jgi:4-amino-4-deoxy-L-arabinose transferase-like glycosyltransferase